jgi:hypothetical protein
MNKRIKQLVHNSVDTAMSTASPTVFVQPVNAAGLNFRLTHRAWCPDRLQYR